MDDQFSRFTRVRSGDVRRDAGIVSRVDFPRLCNEQRVFIGKNEAAIAIDFHGLIVFQPGDLECTVGIVHKKQI